MAAVHRKARASAKRGKKDTAEDMAPLKLRQLKERLRPLVNHKIYGRKLDMSDISLTRWLKVSDFDAIKADAKIRKCLEFREQMMVDSLIKEYKPPNFLLDYYAGGLCGEDKEDSPVYYEFFGLLNLKSVLKAVGKDGLIKYKLYQHEKILKYLKKLSKGQGKTIESILVIVDLQFCKKENTFSSEILIWSEILELLLEHYPCLFKEILLLNSPEWYPNVQAALQPYLSKTTRKLINIVGKNSLPALFQRIHKKNIPAYLGGEKADLDKHKYSRLDIDYWNMQIPGWMKVTDARCKGDRPGERRIAGGSRKLHGYEVDVSGTTISWRFTQLSQPVELTVFQNSLGEKDILKSQQISPSDVAQVEEGQAFCPTPGRYLVVLDNRKNNKATQLIYQTEIQKPEVGNSSDKEETTALETTPSLILPSIDQEGKRLVTRDDYMKIVKGVDTDWLSHF